MLHAKLGGTLIIGAEGKSAYEIAVKNGFVGTETEWLASLKGKSAYEYAKAGGFPGTEAEFADKLAGEYIKTVNGITPDENGNVAVEAGGVTDAEKSLILKLFRNAAYTAPNMADTLAQLEALWSGGDVPDEPDVPDVPDEPVGTTYTITAELVNVASSNRTSSVTEGASYSTTLTANDGYEISSVTVFMGGVDVTADVYADGVISIPAVTGNVEIVASAVVVETEAALPENGLIAFFDLRNLVAGEDYNNTHSDGKTSVNATIGDYWGFCWANNSIADCNDYGLRPANTRAYAIAPIDTSNSIKAPTAVKTVAYLAHGTCPTVYGQSVNQMTPSLAPSYYKTDGTTAKLDSVNFPGFLDQNQYSCIVCKIDNNVLSYFVNGTKFAEFNGNDLADFSSWMDEPVRMALFSQKDETCRITACAAYSTALTDIEILELYAYLKTLEVT